MTFGKRVYLTEYQTIKCKNTRCNNSIYQRVRDSYFGHDFMFCSLNCKNDFVNYEYKIRRLLKNLRSKLVVSKRSLLSDRGNWRAI